MGRSIGKNRAVMTLAKKDRQRRDQSRLLAPEFQEITIGTSLYYRALDAWNLVSNDSALPSSSSRTGGCSNPYSVDCGHDSLSFVDRDPPEFTPSNTDSSSTERPTYTE